MASMKIIRLVITPLIFLLLGGPVTSVMAVEWQLQDIDGKQHAIKDYRGRWIVVNFWATWCPPCLEEIPELISFHDQHVDKDALVLGINSENISRDKLVDFVDEYMVSYPVLPLSPHARTPFGQISGLPTTILINPEGKAVAIQRGTVTAEMIEEYIARQ